MENMKKTKNLQKLRVVGVTFLLENIKINKDLFQ